MPHWWKSHVAARLVVIFLAYFHILCMREYILERNYMLVTLVGEDLPRKGIWDHISLHMWTSAYKPNIQNGPSWFNFIAWPGLWKYNARLVRLVHFHSGQVENLYQLVLGQVQMHEVNTILYIVLIFWVIITSSHVSLKTVLNPDQLASEEASWSRYTLFTRELISDWL